MSEILYAPIYALTRGDVNESIHYGSIAIVNPTNELVAWYGNPEVVTFLRSSAKPFQALPLIEMGGQEAYQLDLREIALICASHSGTDEHYRVAQSIQTKTGVLETDLLCGVHLPLHRATAEEMRARGEAPTPNRHNCSGKHTGMVAYARLRNLPHRMQDHPYIDPDHPIQQEILQTFAAMCDLAPSDVHVGIDGCSAPNFAVPLRNAALAFARLCDPSGLPKKRATACQTICDAMRTYPDMVGGPDSFDTHLMHTMKGKVVCKGGAEGYQALGIMPDAIGPGSPALGITFKISDGDLKGHSRSPEGGNIRPAVTLEILRQLGVITPEELRSLEGYGPSFILDNFREIQVGKGYPLFQLSWKR